MGMAIGQHHADGHSSGNLGHGSQHRVGGHGTATGNPNSSPNVQGHMLGHTMSNSHGGTVPMGC